MDTLYEATEVGTWMLSGESFEERRKNPLSTLFHYYEDNHGLASLGNIQTHLRFMDPIFLKPAYDPHGVDTKILSDGLDLTNRLLSLNMIRPK